MRNKKPIVKYYGWMGIHKSFTIPTGHKLIPASNLMMNGKPEIDYWGNPVEKRYWLVNLPKSEKKNVQLQMWHNAYGTLIYESDLK